MTIALVWQGGTPKKTSATSAAAHREVWSTSVPIAQTVSPALTGSTAVGGVQTMAGVTGVNADGGWICTLRNASWGPVSSVITGVPDGMAIPYGVFQSQIDTCGYNGPMFTVPPAGRHALPTTVTGNTRSVRLATVTRAMTTSRSTA